MNNSPVTIEQFKKQLERMDEAYAAIPFHPDYPSQRQEDNLLIASNIIQAGLSDKLHMLFDEIDRLQTELDCARLGC